MVLSVDEPDLGDLRRRIDAAFTRNGTTAERRAELGRRAVLFINERILLPDGTVSYRRMDLNEFYRLEAERKIP